MVGTSTDLSENRPYGYVTDPDRTDTDGTDMVLSEDVPYFESLPLRQSASPPIRLVGLSHQSPALYAQFQFIMSL